MTTTPLRAKCKPQSDGFALLVFSDRLAAMYRALKRPGRGGRKDYIVCFYFGGFSDQAEAEKFVAHLKQQLNVYGFVREAQRVVGPFEVKVPAGEPEITEKLLAVVRACLAKAPDSAKPETDVAPPEPVKLPSNRVRSFGARSRGSRPPGEAAAS